MYHFASPTAKSVCLCGGSRGRTRSPGPSGTLVITVQSSARMEPWEEIFSYGAAHTLGGNTEREERRAPTTGQGWRLPCRACHPMSPRPSKSCSLLHAHRRSGHDLSPNSGQPPSKARSKAEDEAPPSSSRKPGFVVVGMRPWLFGNCGL